MKIAFITDGQESIPPTKFGGIEWMIHYIASRLGKNGHIIHVYGAVNKRFTYTDYQVIPIQQTPLRDDLSLIDDDKLKQLKILLGLSKAAKFVNRENYDLIHNHAGRFFLLFSAHLNKTVLTTIHGVLREKYQQFIFKEYKDYPYVSISFAQRKPVEDQLNFIANIYNGIDLAKYLFREEISNSYMVFLGRISRGKGVREAAEVAQTLKKRIKIAGFTDVREDKKYLADIQKKYGKELITYIGPLYLEEKAEFIGNSRLFLFPLQLEESFGLVIIESLATGTPLVAYARGSIPEIIKDGETGFIVNSSDEDKRGDWIIKKTGIDGLCEAVERIYAMPEAEYKKMRIACRQHVEKNFTVERMVDDYIKIYEKILSKKG